jgi:hypothetical protein
LTPPHNRGHALHPGPYPPDLSRWNSYGALTTDFSRAPSRLACRTRAVWQYRHVPSLSGLLPPSPAPPGSGFPQLQPGRCDDPAAESFHLRTVMVRSTRGALPVLPQVGFPESPPAPAVHLSAQRALPKPRRVWGYLMLCSAMVPRSLFPGSSSAWR